MNEPYPYNKLQFSFYGFSPRERILDKLNIEPLVYETTFQVNGQRLPEPKDLHFLASSRVDPCEGLAHILAQIGERTELTGGPYDRPKDAQEYLLPDGTSVRIRPESVGRNMEDYGVTAASARVRSHCSKIPRWLRDVFAAVGEPVLPHCHAHRVVDLREDEGLVNVRTSTRKERALTATLADAAIALFEPEQHRAEGTFTYEADVKRYFVEHP